MRPTGAMMAAAGGVFAFVAWGAWVPAPGSTARVAGPGAAASHGPARAAEPLRPTATFAAGCFWCSEADFEKVPGVVQVVAGYTGGKEKNPTYEQVSSGMTGHAESIQVTYDPGEVTYEQLLDYFWHHVDPFTGHRQFCDVGNQYRPAIFYHDEEQKRLAETSKTRIDALFKKPVAVQIVPASPFYRAEEYHQDFHVKNPARYSSYRAGCGRDRRLQQIWGERR